MSKKSHKKIPQPHYTREEWAQHRALREARKRVTAQESPYYKHRMGHLTKEERAMEKLENQRKDEKRRLKDERQLDQTTYSFKKSKVRFIKHNQ